jgi:hypothetical protein
MTYYPIFQVLFFIAITLAPHGTSSIVLTGPDANWTWTKQESGWSKSVDQSAWKVDGSIVISRVGADENKEDVSGFIKGVKNHDWKISSSLKLTQQDTLTKKEKTFIYTQNAGQLVERKYVIEFKKK